jgi:8-oxo-dGTP pyrophosphatase MutT (NUDIX family)
LRESWEEAGIEGKLLGTNDHPVPLLVDYLVQGKSETQLHTYYGLEIIDIKEDWPEKKERVRQFFSFDEARIKLNAQERRRDREAQCLVLENLKASLSHQDINLTI